MVTIPARVPSPRLQDGRPFRAVMATRREPTEYGGVERVVAGLIAELERSRPDWQVESVAAFPAGSRIEGVDLLADVIAGLRLGWRLRTSSAEVIYVHCAEVLWGIRLLRRRRGAPPIITVWHGAGPKAYLTLRRPGHPIAWLLARLRTAMERGGLAADAHIAVHQEVADNLRSLYGYTGPVTVVENGLDSLMADQLSQPAPAREGDGINAVWAGQTDYRKGLDVALAAVAEARRDLPGLRLTVVGVAPGEPTDGVDWLGVLPPSAMPGIYRKADLLLFPTRYESFGMVVIEAMAAGLPVIVSDEIRVDIVRDGRSGVVVSGHDPADYAAALRRLADPRVRAEIGAVNREDVRSYSIESFGAGYAAVAEALAAAR
jgi:glycosyltransferase involved in cell wall biosynthesis